MSGPSDLNTMRLAVSDRMTVTVHALPNGRYSITLGDPLHGRGLVAKDASDAIIALSKLLETGLNPPCDACKGNKMIAGVTCACVRCPKCHGR